MYSPGWNTFEMPYLLGHPFYAYVYLLICLTALIFLIYFRKSFWPQFTLGAFCLLVVLQTINQHAFLTYRINTLEGKTSDQRRFIFLGEAYSYVLYAKSHLPHRNLQGQFISDLNVYETLEPYILQYYLYPRVNIIDPANPTDCLIIFKKKNPLAFVPEHFSPAELFDPNALIALRKNP